MLNYFTSLFLILSLINNSEKKNNVLLEQNTLQGLIGLSMKQKLILEALQKFDKLDNPELFPCLQTCFSFPSFFPISHRHYEPTVRSLVSSTSLILLELKVCPKSRINAGSVGNTT